MPLSRFILASIVLTLAASPVFAQSDAPAPDATQLLQFLKSLKDQQAQQVKAAKQKFLQEAQSAAASPSAAANAWVEAVRQTQFEGVEKEGSQFREWREREGAAFSEAEVQKATQLYFRWLVLTMQRSTGTPVKELLPQVIQYTKDVTASQTIMQEFAERAEKDKQLAQSRMHGNRKDTSREDDRTRKVHAEVLGRGLAGSPPIKAMKAEDLVKTERWPMNPGNVDEIFNQIILPELRLARDPRVFEYWDMKIKKASEGVKDRPAFEQEKFNKEIYPGLLWARAQEYSLMGQPNRALGEMLKVLRTYPQHPNLGGWINQVEQLLEPTPAPTASPSPTPTGTSAKTQ